MHDDAHTGAAGGAPCSGPAEALRMPFRGREIDTVDAEQVRASRVKDNVGLMFIVDTSREIEMPTVQERDAIIAPRHCNP